MTRRPPEPDTALDAFLLGRVEFDDAVRLQRRLAYDVGGERQRGAVILCEHPPLISIGREGSRAHVLFDDDELAHREWPVRWVGRGGGCLLHLPGQLAVYPIVALDRIGLTVGDYVRALHIIIKEVIAAAPGNSKNQEPNSKRADSSDWILDFGSWNFPPRVGVYAGDRMIAHVGVAVASAVTTFGAAINLTPDLEPFRQVRCDGDVRPMTSLERERRQPVRPALVRQLLVEAIAERFGFARLNVLHSHPTLARRPTHHAHASRSA